MSGVDLNEMSSEALVHRELQLERDLVTANFRHRTGQLDDTSTLKTIRRGIARCRTIQRQREIGEGLPKLALLRAHRATFVPGAAESAEGESGGGFLKGFASKLGIGEDEEG